MRTFSGLGQKLSGMGVGRINIRRSLLVVAICGILMADVLTGGALQRRVLSWKRYGQAAMIALVGLGLLLLVNKPGADKMSMMHTATGIVSALPSSATTQLISSGLGYMHDSPAPQASTPVGMGSLVAQPTRVKRSVSEARKRAVAAQQDWRCAGCAEMLEATYEVDHVIELQDGGTNEIENLTALCRNCHGRKTLDQRLNRSEY